MLQEFPPELTLSQTGNPRKQILRRGPRSRDAQTNLKKNRVATPVTPCTLRALWKRAQRPAKPHQLKNGRRKRGGGGMGPAPVGGNPETPGRHAWAARGTAVHFQGRARVRKKNECREPMGVRNWCLLAWKRLSILPKRASGRCDPTTPRNGNALKRHPIMGWGLGSKL